MSDTVYGFNSNAKASELSRWATHLMSNHSTPDNPTGWEVRVAELTEAVNPSGTTGADSVEGPYEAKCLHFGTSNLVLTEQSPSVNLELYNVSKNSYTVGDVVTVARWRTMWIIIDVVGGSSQAEKRVKFKLNAPLYVPVGAFSGSATATVIDPMNSGVAIGSTLQVHDYQKQFEFTQTGSVGIAYLDDAFGTGDKWQIETCTQLITRCEIDLTGDLIPWGIEGSDDPVPTSTIVRSMSPYPDVLWATSNIDEDGQNQRSVNEGIGATIDSLRNPLGLVATAGRAVCERRPIQSQVQDEDNQVVPYTVTPQAWYWAIVSVENEVSDWARTVFNYPNFTLSVEDDTDHAGGVDPTGLAGIANGMASNPPTKLWGQMSGGDDRRCHIPANTEGWAFLDKSDGRFRTVATGSSLFGIGEKLKVVADLDSENSDLIQPSSECGKFQYKRLINVIAFGTTDSNSTCQMKLDPVPDPTVDVFENATDLTVVTGTEINGTTGELEFTTKSIRACDTPSGNLTLPYTTQDVVTDLNCGADSLEKSYRTIKFIGSSTGGADQVTLPCTDPNNYNWQYIFENHVYPSNWWNVSYYDITYPDGCEPCPTGCCTITYQGSVVSVTDGLTENACADLQTTEGGDARTWIEGATSCPPPLQGCCTGGATLDGVQTSQGACLIDGGSWAAGPCGGACENDVVSGFSIGGFASAGCSASFTQTGTATITGGTATINGTWSGLANSFPVGSVAGTFTFTTDGTNHSASGTLPNDWGGGTVSVSDTGTCGGTYSGTATLSGGNSPCGSMINGTYDFDLV